MKTLLKVVRFFCAKTPVIRLIDGHKSEIGFALLALSIIADLLIRAVDIGCANCGVYGIQIHAALQTAEPILYGLGVPIMSLGVADKMAKAKIKK